MSEVCIEQQEHGYRNGHQLLSASMRLPSDDQDTVDRLSDIAGALRPDENFAPYLSAYPLPSGTHYVVARTWQDHEAPRAGCVLTRSLLVPMEYWESFDSITRILALLLPVDRDGKATSTFPARFESALPEVQDPRTVELVEALFLENRQPIVFFEAVDAESIVARLLSALWPSFRRNFAVSTFALAPRKIEGRLFDLLFVPKSARSRFNDWSGRRIEISRPSLARHRWSAATAARIFQSPEPSLSALDPVGILQADSRGDEAALRLSLLWNELSEKVSSTPTAILGLLDILNSQRGGMQAHFESLSPQVKQALAVVEGASPESEAWNFLRTLVGKFPEESPPALIAAQIEGAALTVARRNAAAALEFLGAESKNSRTVPTMLMRSIAEGLASSVDALAGMLTELLPRVGVRLMELSPTLARAIVQATKREPAQWTPALQSALQRSTRESRRTIRRYVLADIDDAALAPMLAILIEGIEAQDLADTVRLIGSNTGFAIAAFDEPLGNSARDEPSLHSLREVITKEFDSAGADRFLLSTMRLDAADVAWLHTEVSPERACRLLNQLLSGAPDRALIALQRDPKSREHLLQTLVTNLSACAPQAARLLTLSDMPIDQYLSFGELVLPHLAKAEQESLADQLLMRAFANARLGDSHIPRLIGVARSRSATNDWVSWATADSATAERVAENLVLLESGSSKLRDQLAAHVDNLSDRLVHRSQSKLGAEGFNAWARLIAACRDEDIRFRAASPALSFAFQHPTWPVSPLVVACFPVVYAQLLRSKEGDDKTVPAFLALPMSFFVDWDRARSARREIVDAYLDSKWPPADLLATALKAGIEQDTLERLSKRQRGRLYIAEIEKDIPRLDSATQRLANASLREFRS